MTEEQYCEFLVTFDHKVTDSSVVDGMKEYEVEVRKDLSDLDKKKLKDYTIDKNSFLVNKSCYDY